MIKQQKIQPLEGPFKVAILLDDTRSGDCDNRIKGICDLLVSNGIVQGDQKKYMKGVSIEWAKVDGCVVSICSVDKDSTTKSMTCECRKVC